MRGGAGGEGRSGGEQGRRGGEGRGREERRGEEREVKWKGVRKFVSGRRGEEKGWGNVKRGFMVPQREDGRECRRIFLLFCFCMHAHVQSPVVAFLIIRTGDMKEAMCMYVCMFRGSKGGHRASLPQPYPFNCSGSDFEALLAGELGTQEGEGGEEEQD